MRIQPVPIICSRPEIPQTLKQQIVYPDPGTPSVFARCLHPAVAQIIPPAGRPATVFVTCLEVIACQPTASSCSTELETAATLDLNLPRRRHHQHQICLRRSEKPISIPTATVRQRLDRRQGRPGLLQTASAAISTSRLSPSASGSSCRLSTADSPPVVQHMSTEADPSHLASVQRPGYVAHLARSRRRRRRQQQSSPAASSPASSRSAQVCHLYPRRQSASITWPVRSPTPAGSLVAPAACRSSASRRRSRKPISKSSHSSSVRRPAARQPLPAVRCLIAACRRRPLPADVVRPRRRPVEIPSFGEEDGAPDGVLQRCTKFDAPSVGLVPHPPISSGPHISQSVDDINSGTHISPSVDDISSGPHIRQSVDDISSGLHPTSVNQQWASSHIRRSAVGPTSVSQSLTSAVGPTSVSQSMTSTVGPTSVSR
ncbi:hypothetical protein ACLOJK_007391 [Asimina triloba]